jgi:hypothetical protein
LFRNQIDSTGIFQYATNTMSIERREAITTCELCDCYFISFDETSRRLTEPSESHYQRWMETNVQHTKHHHIFDILTRGKPSYPNIDAVVRKVIYDHLIRIDASVLVHFKIATKVNIYF